MSQEAKLNNEPLEITTNKDSIIIQHEVADLPGGATLDVSNLSDDEKIIEGGRVIVKLANGDYAPKKVTDGAYVNQSGETSFGILKRTILKSRPQAAILTIGQVNEAALPVPVTDEIKESLVTIKFA